MSTSRTEAHKTFATLYRKQRSPEHQKKVDEIITRSNDVFIRIDLIRKLDEEFEKQNKTGVETIDSQAKKNYSLIDDVDLGKSNEKQSPSYKSTIIQQPPPTTNTQVDDKSASSGLLGMFFGSNTTITKFAKESRAIDIGLFGRKFSISKSVEKIFRSLKEEQILSTILALKYCEQAGWRHWNALTYNIIMNYNRFFNTFISLDSLFLDEISIDLFLSRSTKMQMYYARLLSRPECREIILDKVPALIKLDDKLSSKLESILIGLNYGLNLESQRPTLTDAICAFYIVRNKKMISWPEIEKALSITPIEEHRFNGSPEVNKQIDITIAKLSNDIEEYENIQEDVSSLKKYFFDSNDAEQVSKITFDFINEIIDDYISYSYPENMQTAGLKSTFKMNPHRLVYLLCRDLQTIYFPMFEGQMRVELHGDTKDIQIITQPLFAPEVEKINNSLKTLDVFSRKFPSFQYSFQSFNQDVVKGTQDQIETQLIKVLTEAGDGFGKFARKLSIIIDNHRLAIEYEKKDMLNEKAITTRDKAVDDIKSMHRFIPFHNALLITGNRIDGRTVFDVIYELTKYMYNYAILFKDKSTTSRLFSNRKIETELDRLHLEYERLTGTPFQKIKTE